MLNHSASVSAAFDRPVKATADDAILAKLATAQAGYYVDPFLDAFSQGLIGITDEIKGGGRRRRTIQPIIKRGTHARVCVMDRALSAFLTENSDSACCQVCVLGAGKDTSYFRYCNGNIMGTERIPKNVIWYEVHHTSVLQEKANLI
jgi:O-methyltransferase involved in polyketide biosynthesis